MTNINKKCMLYATAFLLGGCLNEPNIAGEIDSKANNPAKKTPVQTCEIPADAFNNLPTDVLYRTDVVDLGSFKPANISGVHFHTEMGGATIEINAQQLNGLYKIQRTHKEPDLENTVKNYNNLCVKEGRLYGDDVRGIFTEKGVLWLELKSGNEFISSDLWIYLEQN